MSCTRCDSIASFGSGSLCERHMLKSRGPDARPRLHSQLLALHPVHARMQCWLGDKAGTHTC